MRRSSLFQLPRAQDKKSRRGAILVLLALLLPVILMLAAFAVNLAYMELNRTELQISTDTAARAAGRDLNVTNSTTQAITRAQQLAQQNPVAGTPLTLKSSDLVFGLANRPSANSRYTFTAGGAAYNAVQITGCRNSSSTDGTLRTMLPNFLSLNQIGTTQVAQSTQGEIDIALVVDHSGSMAYAINESSNIYPTPPASAPPGWVYGDAAPPAARWRNVVAAIAVFVNDIAASACSDQLALVSFNDVAQLECPLSFNYSPIAPALDVYTQHFPTGSTAIGDGIIQGINALAGPAARPWAAKAIIVLTDGLSNAGTDPLVAAQQAANQNIMIFTVTVSDESDQAGMTQVAQIGGGKHYHCTTPSDITSCFNDIANKLPIMLCH